MKDEKMKLNQLLAILKGRKKESVEKLTAAYKLVQKPELFNGLSKTYKPLEELGEVFPPESKLVQAKANDVIESVMQDLAGLFDLVITQDIANCTAKADVVVDGNVILSQMPVTYLLFLEKQLTDLATFVGSIPVLDPSESWTFNSDQGYYVSDRYQSSKSKKVPKSHVKYEATKEHPAQVEMYHEDVTVGYWTAVKFSGALPATRRTELLNRIKAISEAVKFAREAANETEVKKVEVGEKLLKMIFSK